MSGPVLPGDARGKTLLLFAGGLLATIAVVAGLVLLWPSGDDGDDEVVTDRTTTTRGEASDSDGALGEPSERTSTTAPAEEPEEPVAPVDLFTAGADDALADMVDAAGNPSQGIEISVYPTYAFLAYRDPAHPENIDRRSWRDGEDMDDAAPNPINDRVDGDSEPLLFALSKVDLSVLPRVADDAPGRFSLDVDVTHVIINRFLPFDERVLIRVYASPSDGRSGGGYVQYTLTGSYVKTIQ